MAAGRVDGIDPYACTEGRTVGRRLSMSGPIHGQRPLPAVIAAWTAGGA